ncbi:MAG: DUF1156 domain-containing protein [Prochloraceae cyanobacterium]|nr:DUF1156 domain-containing protein [Prochloraceae cyanobacterium]
MRKKLIEIALPLEVINVESGREKSIRHGHPSTLHLWWSRKPLATCRAVLFASLVDDPSSWPEKFPTEAEQKKERQRLFDILGKITTETDKKGKTKQIVRGLVSWNDVNDPNSQVLENARQEIARSIAPNWNIAKDTQASIWKITQYLIRELEQNGETGVAKMLARLGDKGELARDLAYRLYNLCDRKKWAAEALAYNSLVISWPEICRLALEEKK